MAGWQQQHNPNEILTFERKDTFLEKD